ALSFVPAGGLYGPPAARAILAGLRHMRFSGRCECYTWDSPRGDDYVVSLALKNRVGDGEPTYTWWKHFVQAVAARCRSNDEIKLDVHSSELASVEGMRRNCLPCGVAEFVDGGPRAMLDDAESWFASECAALVGEQTRERDPGRSEEAAFGAFRICSPSQNRQAGGTPTPQGGFGIVS
ncbi:MAG TPA: hypothetical protein VGX78_06160, partial [Pirellulales bacterium]|nr:hypothetical protein [Pirellulales bacterium]